MSNGQCMRRGSQHRRWVLAAWASLAAAPAGASSSLKLSSPLGETWGWTLLSMMAVLLLLLVVYALRHYVFTLNRLFGRQRHP